MHRHRFTFGGWSLAWLFIAAWVSARGMLARADDGQADTPIRYRRIFAPAESIKDWPRGNERYVPVEPEEFERLVDLATSATLRSDAELGRLESIVLHARLTEDGVMHGTCSLALAPGSAGSSSCRWSPCNLAIVLPPPNDAAAAIELTSTPDGEIRLAAEASRELACEWSLRPTRQQEKALQFDFVLPAAPRHTLLLDFPSGLSPKCSRGISIEEAAPDKSRRRWRIELGGVTRCSLDLAPSESA
ncbi:MAG TPA: hypothetical protein VG713_22705, partial [Pirellulales bacterium]|nr:hypothetical protein [Pirellulales bacterium]